MIVYAAGGKGVGLSSVALGLYLVEEMRFWPRMNPGVLRHLVSMRRE